MTRFKFNWGKAIQAIDFIARRQPGVTQYYVSKIMFFADREHLLDYGRPIIGDRYVAMEHGPVPSSVLNLLKNDSGFPDEMIDLLHSRVGIDPVGNKQHIYSKELGDFPDLSGTDKQYLGEAVERYGRMPFSRLKELSREDPVYEAAWKKLGDANEMDVELWLNSLDEPETAKRQLREYAICG